MDDSILLPAILETAVAAGRILLEKKKHLSITRTKVDGSPVTEADLEADAFVRSRLQDLAPDIPVVSEESPIPPFSVRKLWLSFWLVDALDGTKEYLAGRDEYTVNIALIRAARPVLGVVFAPEKGVVYFASESGGSWKRTLGDGSTTRILSRHPDPGMPLIVVESRSHPSPELEGYLRQFKIRERIKMGSSLKFCLLAEGRAQIYPRFGPTMEWDLAAGDCVFRCSGELVSRASPLRYGQESLRNGPFVLGLD